ncbi:MAG: MBL fold metallo-hydrolase [Gorillibacterium sp.]|nr:MBL fold metallo-hydrolase [Gorillibacterium sp.]
MRIMDGIHMLEITQVIMGKQDTINPTLFFDEDNVILVDSGYPGQLEKLREVVEQAGLTLDAINKIIVTHQDIDHIGCLSAIQANAIHPVEILADEAERPYIEGTKGLIRITPEVLAGIDAIIPLEVPEEWRRAFKATLMNPPSAKVDRTVTDGELLPYCGGITVIRTPGHTPGHICLYHHKSQTLIAGDALTVRDGQLFGPEVQLALDPELAYASLQKLHSYDIATVICYHGGIYQHHVNERIAELSMGHS